MLYRIIAAASDHDLIADRLWAAGTTGIEQRADSLIAGFDAPVDLDFLGAPYAIFEPEHDWVETQRAGIETTEAGRFLVHPPWVEPNADEHHIVIEIDPGAAFGHGGHPTTAMCLELLSSAPIAGATVADVGCGTGVLAIAAALLGARGVSANDIDPVAVEMTSINARRNGVDIEITSEPRPADLALVNVTIDVHEHIATRVDAPALILSGVLEHQVERLEACYGAELTHRITSDGWVAGRLRRTPAHDTPT